MHSQVVESRRGWKLDAGWYHRDKNYSALYLLQQSTVVGERAGQGESGEADREIESVLQPKQGLAEYREESEWVWGTATHYGESYNGQPLGCGGIYDSNNPTILAVGPANYGTIPCGARVEVCSYLAEPKPTYVAKSLSIGDYRVDYSVPEVRCIYVIRQDSCPGCLVSQLDLSEAGFTELGCVDVCQIVWRIVK